MPGVDYTGWNLLRRVLRPAALALLAIGASTISGPTSTLVTPNSLFGRPVRLDRDRKLISWSETDSRDPAARDQAARSLNWATYACRDDGIVAVAENPHAEWWFSNGYGDYIRHFLVAMAAVPEWAPRGENHLLRSTSVVSRIDYGQRRVAWTTYNPTRKSSCA
jgi:hypothetical protein